jgi:hypothetical protein
LIENIKDKEEIKIKTTNIIIDFISLNPEYADALKRNDKAIEFLKSLGLEF